MKYTVEYKFLDHEMHKDLWYSKRDLFEAFFKEFYLFIKRKKQGKIDLEKHNIKNLQDFYAFADWNAEGQENCYAMGFAFHPYFLTVVDEDKNTTARQKLQAQPTSTFLGYCVKNHKFEDFIDFLLSYFPYWRNDETCTCFDPYNHADQFFNSSWAVLVDTCKLFYFDSETVFHWITFRIKYIVGNIPGTIQGKFKDKVTYSKEKELERVRVSGYEFMGWFDKDGNEVKKVNKDITLYAKLIRKDHYDYWEKEEPSIKKVDNPNWKKVDPA